LAKGLDMDNELTEVSAFVGSIPPFDSLPVTLLEKVRKQML